VFAFLTHAELSEDFAIAALPDNPEEVTEIIEVADNYLIINKSTLESKKEITKSETAPPINPHLSEETKVEEKPKKLNQQKRLIMWYFHPQKAD